MIFLILIGADMLNSLMAVSQIPNVTSDWVQGLGIHPIGVMLVLILIYVLLGCVMDSLSMILITIPIFLPIVMGLDFYGLAPDEKAIWFGIIALVAMEMGLITPPVGMNVYIINGIAKDVPMATIFRGVVPFIMSDLVRLALMIGLPSITLGLLWLFPT